MSNLITDAQIIRDETTLAANTAFRVGSWMVNAATTIVEISSSVNSLTGSLFGTSSWAQNAQTASFLPVDTYQITSSWAQNVLNDSYLYPEMYGAVGDGITDDSDALNSVGNAAKNTPFKILLSKTYRISTGKTASIYNDIDCLGEIHLYGTAQLRILRANSGVNIDPTPYIEFLTKGSYQLGIPDIENYTVAITSSDVMIKRFQSDTPYFKEDVVKITATGSYGYSVLDNTYDTANTVSITAYPPERNLTINNLRVIAKDTALDRDLVILRRSDTVLNNFYLSVDAGSRTNARVGIDVRDSVNVIFNNPNIIGVAHQQIGSTHLGYGIYLQRTGNVYINNAVIDETKHGVAARHDKETYINGGFFRSSLFTSAPLDSHWTNGFYVDGATIYSSQSAAVGICGSNVSLKNSTIIEGRGLIAVRTDTPELAGNVIIEDNTWYTSTTGSVPFIFGTTSTTTDYQNFFERTIIQPDYLSIKRNLIYNRYLSSTPQSSNIGYLRLYSRNWERTAIKFLDIDDNKFVSGSNPASLVTENGSITIFPQLQILSGSRIRISNTEFSASNGSFRVLNTKPSQLENLLDIEFNNVKNLGFRTDVDIAKSFVVNGGNVNYFKASTGSLSSPPYRNVTYTIDLNGVTFSNGWVYYATSPNLIAKNCHFQSPANTVWNSNDFVAGGNTQLNSTNIKNAFSASFSNTRDSNADINKLPQLDGWAINSYWNLKNDDTSSFQLVSYPTSTPYVLLSVSSSGLVGIGTISPTAELHISGANADNLFRVSSPSATSALFVSGSGNVGIGTSTPTTTLNVSGSTLLQGGQTTIRGAGATISSTTLRVQNSNQSPGLVVLDNGNVGIGTTSPAARLHISGALSGSILEPTSSGAPTFEGTDGQFMFGNSDGNQFIYVWMAGKWRSGSLSN